MQWLSYIFTRGFVDFFRLVPFGLLYLISDGLAFLLMNVVGYRRKVIMDNLERCFPEKSDAERREIAQKSYRNLSDIIMESLKGTTTSIKSLRKRYTYVNYELINKVLDEGRSVVLAGAHYNNWEWGVITIASGFNGKTVGVYKPMSNQYMDRWFFRTRARDPKMILKSMKDTYASVEEHRGDPTVFILVADQIPSNRKTAITARFFNQPSACLPGTESIARKNNYPVFMYEIQRVKRGHYQLTFSEVCQEPALLQEGEVTQRLMSMIEDTIRREPSSWLWSHKRWKWMPDA